MVADPGAFGGMPAMGHGPMGGPPGPPPGADPYAGPPPGADPNLGAPPPGFGGGAPAPAPGGFGIDQTLQQGQPPPYPADRPLDAGGALAGPGARPGPMAQMPDTDVVPGMVGGPNPVVTVLLIVLTCGIYGVYLLIKNKKAAGG
jgi:hypothetical protein